MRISRQEEQDGCVGRAETPAECGPDETASRQRPDHRRQQNDVPIRDLTAPCAFYHPDCTVGIGISPIQSLSEPSPAIVFHTRPLLKRIFVKTDPCVKTARKRTRFTPLCSTSPLFHKPLSFANRPFRPVKLRRKPYIQSTDRATSHDKPGRSIKPCRLPSAPRDSRALTAGRELHPAPKTHLVRQR